ncbi:unnamed protein product [Linum trigynum]|uniref:Uncharacterized protein n=1 Tax=Linum trigynum TaxID=586398 RepID=A0AAV2CD61_9ROSI
MFTIVEPAVYPSPGHPFHADADCVVYPLAAHLRPPARRHHLPAVRRELFLSSLQIVNIDRNGGRDCNRRCIWRQWSRLLHSTAAATFLGFDAELFLSSLQLVGIDRNGGRDYNRRCI